MPIRWPRLQRQINVHMPIWSLILSKPSRNYSASQKMQKLQQSRFMGLSKPIWPFFQNWKRCICPWVIVNFLFILKQRCHFKSSGLKDLLNIEFIPGQERFRDLIKIETEKFEGVVNNGHQQKKEERQNNGSFLDQCYTYNQALQNLHIKNLANFQKSPQNYDSCVNNKPNSTYDKITFTSN